MVKYKKLKDSLEGPVFTVYTGFKKDLSIDFNSIENHIDWMASNGAKIFYVMPYNSRYSQLREHEIFELNDRVIKMIKRHDNCIAIVSDCIHGPSELSVEMGKSAKCAGADIFASIFREKWFCNEQVTAHYQYLSECINMPLLVHEMPFLSGFDSKNMNWPIDLFQNLTKIDDIIAVKEDTKDIEYAIKTLQFEPRFRMIFAGRKSYFAKLRKHGIKAYLNSISMIDPNYGFEFWNLMKNATDKTLTKWLDTNDNHFWDSLVKKYGWHRCNKSLLEVAGFMNRVERLPLQEISINELREIDNWFQNFKKTRGSNP